MGEGLRQVDLFVLSEVYVAVAVEVVLVDDGVDFLGPGVHAEHAHGLGEFLSSPLPTSKLMVPSPLMSNLLKIFRRCSNSSRYRMSPSSIIQYRHSCTSSKIDNHLRLLRARRHRKRRE